ncbi:6117_t:CDS:2 [Dentiscutata erythropus]|uniref:6117_t:CDS:1 n=1 Tax=Dentiscutata erythropus TaxID=1348616 RepID=A0A9N9CDV1_9GLOM|nr:6117_t:CDS:2 [Dentiscutata erythropus]
MIVALKCLDNSHMFEEFYRSEIPDLFKQLIDNCCDTIPINQPSASVLLELFNNWMAELNDPDSELNVQIKNAKTENITFMQFKTHSEAFYTKVIQLFKLTKI